MGFLSALAKIGGFATKLLPIPGAGFIGDAVGAAGDALGAASQASASNRGTALDAATEAEMLNRARQKQYFDQATTREQDRRAGGASAFREAQLADYVRSGGNAYTPKAGLKSYGFGPQATSQAERDAAENYFTEQQKRLAAGDSLLPQVSDPGTFTYDPKDLKASGFEKFAGIAAPILTGVGGLMQQPKADPLAGLRAEYPDLSDAQIRVIAAALEQKGVKF
jgi:hypothetical protein